MLRGTGYKLPSGRVWRAKLCGDAFPSPPMYYSDDHAALLPEGTDPLPMPETRLELLWILAALSKRRRRGPVPHGPLPSVS